MRDILRWVLHWFSAGEAIDVVPYVLSADVEMRFVAAGDVSL
jgi:Iap family predicted aminopeptidase